MMRFWLGVGILLGLLVLGIVVTLAVGQFCEPISQKLSEASLTAQQGRWELAEQLSERARQRWEQHRALHAAVSNHEPMEQIDALFSQLEIYRKTKDGVRFAECCAQLSSLTAALGESQAVYWWNLL